MDFMSKYKGIDKRLVTVVLVVVLLLTLTCYMMLETAKFNDNQIRLMVTSVSERLNAVKDENPIPITPSVEVRAEKAFAAYPRAMTFLIAAYLVVCFWVWKMDKNLMTYFSAAFLLAGIGCSYKFLYSGFYGLTGEGGFLVVGFFAGVCGYAIWNFMEHRITTRMYTALCLLVLGMLAAIMFFGKTVYGNKGWLSVGGIMFQASEFLKCLLIMLGSGAMNNRKRSCAYSFLCLLTTVCLVRWHDLGAACVLLLLYLMMTYLIFDKKRYAVILILLGVVVLYFVSQNTPYVQQRLNGYLHAMDRTDGVDQQRNFIIQVIKAGWDGLGVANCTSFTKLTAAGTDAALAGVLAVFGLPMLICVFGCYVVILLCFAQNSGVSITCHPILFQLALVITTQVILNFCGALDLLPFTGVTAPLVSTGGSSTVTTCMMLGVAAAAMTPKVQNCTLKKEE